MNESDMTALLRSVQDAALDSTRPVADALRLSLAAGGRLGSTALRKWARQELEGYGDDDELPPYRMLNAQPQVDYVWGRTQATGQTVSPDMVDEDVRGWMYDIPLRAPIAELETLAKTGGESLRFTAPQAGAIGAMIRRRQPDGASLVIRAVYWTATPAAMLAVVDQIRTRLVELVAEFDVALAAPGTAAPEAAAHALNVVIGDGSTVSVTAATGERSSVITSATTTTADRNRRWWERGWWTAGRAIWAAVVGFATITGTWVALASAGVL